MKKTYDQECAEWEDRQASKEREWERRCENLTKELALAVACLLHVKELGGVVSEDTQLAMGMGRTALDEAKRLGFMPTAPRRKGVSS